MNRNIIRFSLFFALSLAFMSISVMAQATSATTTEKIPISGTFTACNGEDIDFEGTETVIMHMTVSSSGKVSMKFGIVDHLTGVSQTTGAKYVGNGTQEVSQRADSIDSMMYSSTFPSHLNFNGQGRVENLKVKELHHITFNANGDITSVKDEFSAECK